MFQGINVCTFYGRLGKDPDIRYLENGTALSNCVLAVPDKYKGKERTEWVSLLFIGKPAEVVQTYMQKGDKLGVSGKLQTDKWQDKNGNTRYTTKVVVEKFAMDTSTNKTDRTEKNGSNGKNGGGGEQETVVEEDQIPF